MKKKSVLAGLAWTALIFSAPTALAKTAGDVVEQVVSAYGGEALTGMTSLFVRDRYKLINMNGGPEPGLAVVSRLHSDLSVDFETGRKSVKNWSMATRGNRLGQIMFDGENGWSVNHLRGSHVRRDDLTGDNVGSGMLRLLDATVVRNLWDSRSAAILKGEVEYLGVPHYRLGFTAAKGPEQVLYINKATGLVSKMVRGRSVYEYSGHKSVGGVVYASDTNLFSAGEPRMVTLSRSLSINADVEGTFTPPESTYALEGMRDRSSMTVVSPADGVYLAGKGNSASIFVDAGDYFIGAGGLGGIKDRLTAVQAASSSSKQLKYQVIPEYHSSHNSGLDEIAELGASFVTVESHVAPLQELLSSPAADDRFLLVEGRSELAEGKVIVYEISTIQSAQYLLFYVPSAKLVFNIDEFGTNLLNSVPSPDKRMVSFRKAIEALELDVDLFAHVHGTGLLTMEQLRQVTDSYQDQGCPAGHTICMD